MSKIGKLREMVEAGGVPTRAEIHAALGEIKVSGWPIGRIIDWILDPDDIRGMGAAKDLHEALLPGWLWASQPKVSALLFPDMPDFDGWIYRVWKPGKGGDTARGDDPARAWLIAILKALEGDE